MSDFSTLRHQAGLSIPDAALKLGYAERTVYRWDNGAKPKLAVLELLRTMKSAPTKKEDSAFTFIDLFAGIGGLRKGFESIGGRCVFTSEWDKYSRKTYLANFPDDEHEIAGDITKIEAKDIPAHDLLIAGFPCQPFSIAGVSKKNALNRPHGFACETQGTLFFDVERIIAHHQPRAFVLENVKNLVNHDKGRTFRVIVDTLRNKLGYHIDSKVIDAKGYVPQHRERIFIVGFKNRPFDFKSIEVADPLKGPKLSTILHSENGKEKPETPFTAGRQATVSDKYTLSDHLWRYLKGYAEKHRAAGNGFGFGLFGPDDVARTLSARYYKDGSEILIKQKGKAPRRLTPRECARLMGFDAPSEPEFKIQQVSDMQAYKQFGNSVVVPVVKEVANYIKPFLLEDIKADSESKTAKHG